MSENRLTINVDSDAESVELGVQAPPAENHDGAQPPPTAPTVDEARAPTQPMVDAGHADAIVNTVATNNPPPAMFATVPAGQLQAQPRPPSPTAHFSRSLQQMAPQPLRAGTSFPIRPNLTAAQGISIPAILERFGVALPPNNVQPMPNATVASPVISIQLIRAVIDGTTTSLVSSALNFASLARSIHQLNEALVGLGHQPHYPTIVPPPMPQQPPQSRRRRVRVPAPDEQNAAEEPKRPRQG